MYSSQWTRLLKNVGIWQGSFTQFSIDGKLIKNTPTVVKLEGFNEDKSLRLTVNRLGENQPPYINEFTSLNRSILLFESGHFAKTSLQFSPFSTFGAEFGFILGDRRLRMVQLFDKNSNLDEITLIREFRENSNASENPALSVEQLVGEWEGEALTLYPDWRDSKPYPTNLKIQREGNSLIQTLKMPQLEINSTATINDSTLTFSENNNPIRVLLLPDGASSTTPLKISLRQSFFLEVGWLVNPNQRLRLIHRYDDKGSWSDVTLVTEFKKS